MRRRSDKIIRGVFGGILWTTMVAGAWAATVRVPGDAATIQEGLNKLAPDGGVLVLAAGPHNDPLGFAVDFSGRAEITIEGNGAIWSGAQIRFDQTFGGVARLDIRGVRFEGVNSISNDGLLDFGADFNPTGMSLHLKLDECTVAGVYKAGINTHDVPHVRIENCHFELAPEARYVIQGFQSSETYTVSGNTFNLGTPPPVLGGTLRLVAANPSLLFELVGNEVLTANPANNVQVNATRTGVMAINIYGNRMPETALLIDGGDTGGGSLDMAGNWFKACQLLLDRFGVGVLTRATLRDNKFGDSPAYSDSQNGDWVFDGQNCTWEIFRNTFLPITPNGLTMGSNMGNMQFFDLAAGSSFHENNVYVLDCYYYCDKTNGMPLARNFWGGPEGPWVYTDNNGGLGTTSIHYQPWNMINPAVIPDYKPWLTTSTGTGFGGYRGDEAPEDGLGVRLEGGPTAGLRPLPVSLRASVWGGQPSYRYFWFINNDQITTATTASLSWTFRERDLHYVRVAVEDDAGGLADDSVTIDTRGERGWIDGCVTDKLTGKPISGAALTLTRQGGRLTRTCGTDGSGEYAFTDQEAGRYTVLATAHDHRATSRTVTLLSGRDHQRVDFALEIPLDEERTMVKLTLIEDLIDYPEMAGEWGQLEVEHPFVAPEAQALEWLLQQNTVTEDLMRLELAERSIHVGACQAAVLGDQFAQHAGSVISSGLELIMMSKRVGDVINKISPLHWLSLKMEKFASRIAVSLLQRVYLRMQTKLMSHATKKFLAKSLAPIFQEINKKWGARYYAQPGISFINPIRKAFMMDFGEKIRPLLDAAVERAIAGGPYGGQNYEDSRDLTLIQLDAMQRKQQLLLNRIAYMDWVAYVADWGNFFSGWTSTMVAAGGNRVIAPWLAPFLMALEGLTKEFDMIVTSGGGWLAFDRLSSVLPLDVEDAVRASQGEVPLGRLSSNAIPKETMLAIPKTGARVRLQSMDPPSSAPLIASLGACKAAVLSENGPGLETALNDQFMPRATEYLDQVEAAADRLAWSLEPRSAVLDQVDTAGGAALLVLLMVPVGSADYLIELDQSVTQTEPRYLDARNRLLGYLEQAERSVGQWARALSQAAAEYEPAALPPVVSSPEAWFEVGGEPTSSITAAMMNLDLVARVRNLGDQAAEGIEIGLNLMEETGLALNGSGTAQTIGSLAADEETTVSWPLTYTGPAYGRIEYAWVEVTTGTTASLMTGPPALALLAAPLFPDADGDEMDDRWETDHQLSSSDPADAKEDPDHDGAVNVVEHDRGTDPRLGDTDGDGLADGEEITLGLNPVVDDRYADDDNDGLSNVREVALKTDRGLPDSDGDGYSDGFEAQGDASPTNPGAEPNRADRLAAIVNHLLGIWTFAHAMDEPAMNLNRDTQVDVGDVTTLINHEPNP
ncbi:MAG: carboxypeptidase regulatory-like domain-containing protein [bacterium]|nr:carboxypeptidase regulatory-like domain-containing protein [bacterium]